MNRRLALLMLALAPAVAGCVAVAGSAAAIVVTQGFTDHAHVAYVREDPDVVWEQAKQTLTHMVVDPVETDDEAMAAKLNYRGAMVAVHVEIYDVGQSKLSVGARKWGVFNANAANDVVTQIKRDLHH